MQQTPTGKTNQSGYAIAEICMFISVITSLVALTAWIVFLIQNNRIERQVKQIEREQEKLTQRSRKLNNYESALSKLVGLEQGTSLTSENVVALRNDAISSREELTDVQGSMSNVLNQLEMQVRRLAKHHRELRLQNADLEKRLSHQQARLQSYEEISDNHPAPTYIAQLETTRERLNQRIEEARQSGSEAVSAVEDEIASAKESHQETLDKLNESLSQKQNNLNQLKPAPEAQFFEMDEIDARVLRTDDTSDWAFIDIGTRDRVQAGQRFGVYSAADNNDRTFVGMLKVKEVFSDYSRCKIISVQRSSRPILEDDVVDNPFFDTEGPRKIALVGSFTNRDGIESEIKASGSTVAESLSPTIDFVITGTDLEGNDRYNRARELGLLLLKFENIQEFIQ